MNRYLTTTDLTAETLKERLDYDYETGLFRWRRVPEHLHSRSAQWNGRYAGEIAGCVHKVSGRRTINLGFDGKRKHYYAAILVWLWMTGEWPTDEVDHENTIRSDDRWSNLRMATRLQNMCNTGLRRNSTTGIKGVSYYEPRQGFRAYISLKRKRRHLGYFDTIEQAAEAYARAAAELHGEFARIA